jgi:type III pantothenate kinase
MGAYVVAAIGNSTIRGAVSGARKATVRGIFSVPAADPQAMARVRNALVRIRFEESAVCSTVPSLTPVLCRVLKERSGRTPLVIGRTLRVPLRVRYRSAGTLGADRLLCAWEAVQVCGAPVIVVDCGTAITVNIVDGQGRFCGGAILPGLCMAAKALSRGTAQLPCVVLRGRVVPVGRDTVSCIRAGVVRGAAAAVEGLIAEARKELGVPAPVIATGGDARYLARYSPSLRTVKPDLLLEGAARLFSRR